MLFLGRNLSLRQQTGYKIYNKYIIHDHKPRSINIIVIMMMIMMMMMIIIMKKQVKMINMISSAYKNVKHCSVCLHKEHFKSNPTRSSKVVETWEEKYLAA